jgi:hypothetical protein
LLTKQSEGRAGNTSYGQGREKKRIPNVHAVLEGKSCGVQRASRGRRPS